MATYLIDYENVNKSGLNGVSRLTEKDKVVIFYSAKADKMTFGLHRRLNEAKAVIEYKRVDVGGHNALDFQLATYLGFLISQNPSEEYWIVSNDRGFEYLTVFWRKPLYSVTLTREIAAGSASSSQNRAKNSSASSESDQPVESAEIAASDKTDTQGSVSSMKTKHTGSVSSGETNHRKSVSSVKADTQGSVSSVTEKKEKPDASAATVDGVSVDRVLKIKPELRSDSPSASGEKRRTGSGAGADEGRKMTSVSISGEKRVPDSATYSDRKPAVKNRKEASVYSVKEGKRDASSVQGEKSTGGTEKQKPAGKAEERSRTRRNDSQKESSAAGVRKAAPANTADSVAAGVDPKETRSQNASAGTGRGKTRLGLNHALMRLFGTHKNSETDRTAKPFLQEKKGKDEQKSQKLSKTPEANSGSTKSEKSPKTNPGLSKTPKAPKTNPELSKTTKAPKTNPQISKTSRASGTGTEVSKAARLKSQVEKSLSEEVRQLTSNLELSEEERRDIASFIQKCRTKQSINNELVRRFHSQKAGEVYKAVKPLIQDKIGKDEPDSSKTRAGGAKSGAETGKGLLEEVNRLTENLQLSEEDRRQITSYVQKYTTKQGVNNALVRRFRSEKAGEIYKAVKPLLKEKRGRNSGKSNNR